MLKVLLTLVWVLLIQVHAREWPWSKQKTKALKLKPKYKLKSEVAWIGTLNGELHALNTRTGDLLWSANLGGATLRTFQAVESADTGIIIPGSDGSIYVHSQGELKRYPFTVPDFVAQSPMFQVLPNGRRLTIVGSKSDRVFQIDSKSGRVLRSFSSDDAGGFASEDINHKKLSPKARKRIILVKRHDYRVRAFDEESGKEVWNFTYALLDPTSVESGSVRPGISQGDSQLESLMAQIQSVWKHRYPVASAAVAVDGDALVVSRPSIVPLHSSNQAGSALVQRMVMSDGSVQLFVGPANDMYNKRMELGAKELEAGQPTSAPLPSRAIVVVPDDSVIDMDARDDTCVVALGEHKVVPYAPETMGNFPNITIPARRYEEEEDDDYDWDILMGLAIIFGAFIWATTYLRQKYYTQNGQGSNALASGATSPRNGLENALNRSSPELAISQEDGSSKVGKLTVHMDRVKGYGGNGTIVVEGRFEDRPVAVKRMQRALLNRASKEIDFLIQSEGHSNVVRYLAKEETNDFVFLALELCEMTLDQAIEQRIQTRGKGLQKSFVSDDTRLFLYELASATNHLHTNGIVHCDIKPQNVLVVPRPGKADSDDFGSCWVPKLSDMGLSRNVDVEQSSFYMKSHPGTQDTKTHMGAGTVGWRAPELLVRSKDKKSRLSRKVDVFSLGCVFFYVLTEGDHPFGEWLNRESQIVLGETINLDKLSGAYAEIKHMVGEMIAYEPSKRPSMLACLFHPLLWNSKTRLDFLCDVSNRLEKVDPASGMLKDLETRAKRVFPPQLGWASRLESRLERDVSASKHRKYDITSLRDLLRYIRNKRHHFDEDPELSRVLSWEPEAFLQVFCSSFPELTIQTFEWAVLYCGTEAKFLEVCGGAEVVTERSERVAKLAPDEPAVSSSCRRMRRSKTREWYVKDWVNDFPDLPPIQMPPSHNHKSMLCAHWERSGGQFCVMGSKCGFAHGPVELRLLPQQTVQPDAPFAMRPPPPTVNRTPSKAQARTPPTGAWGSVPAQWASPPPSWNNNNNSAPTNAWGTNPWAAGGRTRSRPPGM